MLSMSLSLTGQLYRTFCRCLTLSFRHIVELLLTYEASCNAADEKGSSPLHLAAWAGFAPIVDTLLVHGPSVANANLTVITGLQSRNLV